MKTLAGLASVAVALVAAWTGGETFELNGTFRLFRRRCACWRRKTVTRFTTILIRDGSVKTRYKAVDRPASWREDNHTFRIRSHPGRTRTHIYGRALDTWRVQEDNYTYHNHSRLGWIRSHKVLNSKSWVGTLGREWGGWVVSLPVCSGTKGILHHLLQNHWGISWNYMINWYFSINFWLKYIFEFNRLK